MSKNRRSATMLALMGILSSLLWAIAPTTAQAAESIPELQWPAIEVGQRSIGTTSPAGAVTLGCETYYGSRDLQTFDAAGQLVRQLDRTTNCISTPVVDKNGVVYGLYDSLDSNGDYVRGPNLQAYNGNTLKWEYPLSCSRDQPPSVVVGANGNIYATTNLGDGLHLIGIAPELQSGQTQPSKVLDVKIPNDCSIQLYAYKDGIMLHGQQRSRASYYSYAGKFLGDATAGSIWEERVNSSGQLFVPQWVNSTPRTVKVSMFDPRRGKVIWTEQASTLNANVNDIRLHPLPNGGVLASIWEQKMEAGAPSVPAEYVYTLVTMNALGQKVKTLTLLNSDSAGNMFEAPVITPQVNGKVLVVRGMTLETDSANTRVPGIAVGIYDPVAGTWGYQEVMKGNTQQPDELYGYKTQFTVPVSGTVYLVGQKCGPWACFQSGESLYALDVPDAALDYPRGAVLSANTGTQRTPRNYAALGDSYSSGEGVAPFDEDGTTCHRSLSAYSRVLDRDPSVSLQLGSFAACSGATTSDIWNSQSGQGQVDVLAAGSPKAATITIGGNDILFRNFGVACVVPLSSCNFSSTPYTDSLNAINGVLGGRLEATYKKMLAVTKTAGTKIYVLGYPQVVANKSATAPYDARCGFMYDYNSTPSDPWQEARAARDIVTKLNAKITATVTKVRNLNTDNQRLIFVSATATGSPFTGHEMCSTGTSYFQNLDQYPSNNAAPFHPNEVGQAAYAQLIRTAIGE